MFLDALLTLSDSQALTGTVAVVSANTIDLGNPTVKRDIASGEPMVLLVNVEVALAGTGPGITIEAIQSDGADLSSPDVIASSGAIATAANFPAGAIFQVPIPEGRMTKRYFGARYTMTGTTPTTTVSAFLQPASMASPSSPRHYAKGYTV